jgi:hypothetical protein
MHIRPRAVAIPGSTEHLEKGNSGRTLERAVRASRLEVLLEAA